MSSLDNYQSNIRQMKFIQHNCRSAANKWSQIINYINVNTISIALLSETFNLEDRRITFPTNYQVVHRSRVDRAGGGVAILIHESIKFETIQAQVHAPIEIVAIKTLNTTPNIAVFSIYIPPESGRAKVNPRAMERLFTLTSGFQTAIIGGDFNAHSPLWSNNTMECRRGKILRETLEETELILMNDGEVTMEGPRNRESSTLDLTLVSPNIAHTLRWEVTEENLGSDHLVIAYHITDVVFTRTIPKRKFNTFNKSFFETEILQTLDSQQFPPTEVNDILNIIDDAGERSIKRTKTVYQGRFVPKPWWNEKVKRLYEAKRLTKRGHRTNPTPANYEALAKATQRLKRAIKESKEEAWKQFIADIKPGNMSATYSKIRALKGHLNRKTRQSIVKLGIKNANDFLQSVCSPPCRHLGSITLPRITRSGSMNAEALNDPFELSELEAALHGKKGSAPGLDEINFVMLQSLPPPMKTIFIDCMNSLFMEAKYPDDWRMVEIIPIPKPGKDPLLIASSRPIALIACPAKLMITMVKTRLEYYLEKSQIFSCQCTRFRRGRSSSTAVEMLVTDVNLAFQKKQYTIAAFIDIENAYTRVNPLLLQEILRLIKVPNKILKWITSYLQHRTFVIRTEEGPACHESRWGILQGCPISPTLFNVYCLPLHHIEPHGCKLIQYADDLVLYTAHRSLDTAISNLQQGLRSLNGTLKELNFAIHPQKSVVMPLTRRRYDLDTIAVQIDGERLPVAAVHKFLGIWIDAKLKFSTHVAETNKKANKSIQIIKSLAGVNGGHPKNLVAASRAIVRPLLDFGATTIQKVNPRVLEKYDVILNASMRVSLGAFRSTPINALLTEAGEPPLVVRRAMLTRRELVKSTTNEAHPMHTKELGTSLGHLLETTRNMIPVTDNIRQLEEELYVSNNALIYSLDIPVSMVRLQVRVNIPGLEGGKKKKITTRELTTFTTAMMHELYAEHHHVYTDASKTENGVGIGIYDDLSQLVMSYSLPSAMQINSAELYAIKIALDKYSALNRPLVILTDSKTACLMLSHIHRGEVTNYIAYDIAKTLRALANKPIVVQWVPAHSNIQGNERADEAAKKGALSQHNNYIRTHLPLTDSLFIIRRLKIREWQEWYNQQSSFKGLYHYQIMERVKKKPDTIQLRFPRKDIVQLIRLRTGHGHINRSRFLTKLSETPNCEVCEDVVEDMEHKIMVCPLYAEERLRFNNINENGDLPHLLQTASTQDLKNLLNFMRCAGIRL